MQETLIFLCIGIIGLVMYASHHKKDNPIQNNQTSVTNSVNNNLDMFEVK